MISDVERGIKEVLWKGIRKGVHIKNLKKIKKITFALLVAIAVVFHTPMTAQAADAEFRMMHGEQDAIVVGTIKEMSEEGCLVEKSHVILCKAENTLNRQLPAEEIPDELLIEEIKYRYSYHAKTRPEVGDCIVISVDKEGKCWQQEWMAFEVSSTDISALEVLPPEDMTTGAYAWQLFIRSDGEKMNFAYEGDGILYLDGDVVFDRIEHLNSLEVEDAEDGSGDEQKNDIILIEDVEQHTVSEQAQESVQSERTETTKGTAESEDIELTESESVSVSIIGDADGPTSIFLAGKLGTGFKIAMTLIIVVPVVIIAWIIWRIVKKK